MGDPLEALREAGVSIRPDDLGRERLSSGSLAQPVAGARPAHQRSEQAFSAGEHRADQPRGRRRPAAPEERGR